MICYCTYLNTNWTNCGLNIRLMFKYVGIFSVFWGKRAEKNGISTVNFKNKALHTFYNSMALRWREPNVCDVFAWKDHDKLNSNANGKHLYTFHPSIVARAAAAFGECCCRCCRCCCLSTTTFTVQQTQHSTVQHSESTLFRRAFALHLLFDDASTHWTVYNVRTLVWCRHRQRYVRSLARCFAHTYFVHCHIHFGILRNFPHQFRLVNLVLLVFTFENHWGATATL